MRRKLLTVVVSEKSLGGLTRMKGGADGRDNRDTISDARGAKESCPFGVDATDSYHRHGRSGSQASPAVDSQIFRCIFLGDGGEDRSAADVIHEQRVHGKHLLFRRYRETENFVGSEEVASLCGRHIGLTDMGALCIDVAGEFNAIVDDEGDPNGAEVGMKSLRFTEHRAFIGTGAAVLHDGHPSLHRLLNGVEQAGGALLSLIRDEVEMQGE